MELIEIQYLHNLTIFLLLIIIDAQKLFEPTNALTFCLFRFVFGLCLVKMIASFHSLDFIVKDFLYPEMNFKYSFALSATAPISQDWMEFIFIWMTMGAAFFFAIGFLTKISGFIFLVLYSYRMMIEATRYNNHYYLYCLMVFLLIVTESNVTLSVDRYLLWKKENRFFYFLLSFLFLFLFSFSFLSFFKKNPCNNQLFNIQSIKYKYKYLEKMKFRDGILSF